VSLKPRSAKLSTEVDMLVFPFLAAFDVVLTGDGLARRSGGLSSPTQPCRGRINGVNQQTKPTWTGGCSEILRAKHQRI